MRNEAIEALVNEAHATRERFRQVEPTELGWTPAGHVALTFDDGHAATFSPELLRAICPCAECRGTHTGQPKAFNVLSSAKLQGAARQTVIDRVEPVGSYALAFFWGDGHKDGIYTWTYLRGISEQLSRES